MSWGKQVDMDDSFQRWCPDETKDESGDDWGTTDRRTSTPVIGIVCPSDPFLSTRPPSMKALLNAKTVTLFVGSEQKAVTLQSTLFRGTSVKLDELLNSPSAQAGNLSAVNECLRNFSTDAFTELMKLAYAAITKAEQVEDHGRASLPLPKLTAKIEKPLCRQCGEDQLSLRFTCLSCSTSLIGTSRFFEKYMTDAWSTYMHELEQLDGANYDIHLESKNPVTGEQHKAVYFAKLFAFAELAESPALKVASSVSFLGRLQRWWNTGPTDTDEVIDVLNYLTSSEAGGIPKTSVELGVADLVKLVMLYVIHNAANHMKGSRLKDLMHNHANLGVVLLEILGDMNRATEDQVTDPPVCDQGCDWGTVPQIASVGW